MTFNRKTWVGAAMLTLMAAAAGERAYAQPRECAFEQYVPLSVVPYHASEDLMYGTYTTLSGAQVYVAAEPGLTAEWLNLSVQRGLTAQNGCGAEFREIQVDVTSAGPGFWITLRTPDPRNADALVRWADAFKGPKQLPAAK